MNTAARIGLYVAALALAFVAALGVGNAVGPIDPPGGHASTRAGR